MENQWLKQRHWIDVRFTPLLHNARGSALVLLVVGLSFLWWQAGAWYQEQLLVNERVQVAEQLGSYSNALTIAVNRNFARMEGLKAFVEADPSAGYLDEHFKLFAAGLYIGEEEIRNLVVAPGGANRYVYPLEGNEAAVGHDLLNDPRPEVGAAARRAIETRRIVVTGPYELLQGGQGLVARQAIFHNGEFWGLVSMVLDVPLLVNDSGLNARSVSLEAALRDETGRVFYGSSVVFDNDPVIHRVSLPDGHWELAGYPSGGRNAI